MNFDYRIKYCNDNNEVKYEYFTSRSRAVNFARDNRIKGYTIQFKDYTGEWKTTY